MKFESLLLSVTGTVALLIGGSVVALMALSAALPPL
jgi:hypothetical protein